MGNDVIALEYIKRYPDSKTTRKWRAVQLVNTCICDTNDHFVVGELTCPIVFYKVLDIETEEGEKENDG